LTFYGDLVFFLVLATLSLPAIALSLLEKPVKLYLFFASVAIILIIYGKTSLVWLSLFFVFSLFLIKLYLYLRQTYGRRPWVYRLFLLLLLSPLAANKIFSFFHVNIFGFLGISYITFKVLQMIIEIYDGVIKKVNIFDTAVFLLFFPSLSSGPIDRSRRFSDDLSQIRTRSEYLTLLGKGVQKIALGALYKFIISFAIYDFMQDSLGRYTVCHIIKYVYTYGLYLFFDFAGYSLMAVGTAYIFGIKLPDNFKYPFLSVDIKDFWNRWHITLSHWFRDFVFSRIHMGFIKKKRFKSRLTGASVAYIANMAVMGIWHGVSISYIAYGLYHGVLLALMEFYQKKSSFYAKNKEKKAYKIASWFVTIHAVFFGFYVFSGEFLTLIKVIIEKMS